MLLYAIYRNTEKAIEEKKLPDQQLKTIVVLTTSGSSEVYPVAEDTDIDNIKKKEDQNKKQNEQVQTESGEADKNTIDHKSLEDSSELHDSDECPV